MLEGHREARDEVRRGTAHRLDGNSTKPSGRQEMLEVIKQQRTWRRVPAPNEGGFPFWITKRRRSEGF